MTHLQASGTDPGLEHLLSGDPGPFALLRRNPTGPSSQSAPDAPIEILTGHISAVHRLTDLPLPLLTPGSGEHDLLALIPYRQLSERGYACRDDGEPILAMTVRGQGSVSVADAVEQIPDVPTTLVGAEFDVEDGDYAKIVGRILAEEIGRGEGANFVIQRAFTATIPNFSVGQALAIFRRLLLAESGAYWTFVVHTGSRTFIGASPERHVSLSDGTVVMNPISGTYRYPAGGPTLAGVLEFLDDPKETAELYMVVDEELKMMASVSDSTIQIDGPYLKEMARLAHTEYVLRGHTSLDVHQILRETMFAPTVTGSPLENACRVITRHEPHGRGYYAGALAVIGRDGSGKRTLDSTILIRTADIDDEGHLRMGVGASLVRDSDPRAEADETRAKAAAMMAALGAGEPSSSSTRSLAAPVGLRHEPEVRRALARRNLTLSTLWLGAQSAAKAPTSLAGRQVLVVDAEDRFTAMLGVQLRALGLSVTIRSYDQRQSLDGAELVLMGPGPGDPLDHRDPKIAALRRLTRRAIHLGVPLLSVCLGHQVLAGVLGFEIERKELPNQGVQKEVDLFGRRELVGFYNSFAAFSDQDRVHCLGLPGAIDVSRDPVSGEVHALRGTRFASMQFHPESVLTQNGSAIMADLITSLLAGASDLSPAMLGS